LSADAKAASANLAGCHLRTTFGVSLSGVSRVTNLESIPVSTTRNIGMPRRNGSKGHEAPWTMIFPDKAFALDGAMP